MILDVHRFCAPRRLSILLAGTIRALGHIRVPEACLIDFEDRFFMVVFALLTKLLYFLCDNFVVDAARVAMKKPAS